MNSLVVCRDVVGLDAVVLIRTLHFSLRIGCTDSAHIELAEAAMPSILVYFSPAEAAVRIDNLELLNFLQPVCIETCSTNYEVAP